MTSEGAAKDLRDYLSVIWRRRWLIALIVVLVTAGAATYSYRRPAVYAADAKVLLERNQSSILLSPGISYLDPSLLATEIQIIETPPVRDLVRKEIGVAPAVAASAVGNTAIINIHATGTTGKHAADVANAYAKAYIAYRLTKTLDGLTEAIKGLEARISGVAKDIDALDAQAAALPRAPGAPTPSNPQRDALAGQQALLRQQLSDLNSAKNLQEGGAQLIAPAEPSSTPIGVSRTRHVLLGVAVGLIFGLAVAFAREYIDESIKTNEDLARATPGLPTLGVIPVVSGWKSRDDSHLVSTAAPNSAPAEAYRTLRTSIQFLSPDKPVHVLQITSPSEGEGKTATAANLAVALSRAGHRVVLVNCDLRRPRLHKFFGLPNSTGFTSMLLGESSLATALQPAPNEPRLMLLAAGPVPPNPSELLSSHRSEQVFAALRTHADFVLVDSPPVIPVTDAVVLTSLVDAVLLVTLAGKTSRKEVARAVELLGQVNANLVGTVLNGSSAEVGYSSYRSDPPAARGQRNVNGSSNGSNDPEGHESVLAKRSLPLRWGRLTQRHRH